MRFYLISFSVFVAPLYVRYIPILTVKFTLLNLRCLRCSDTQDLRTELGIPVTTVTRRGWTRAELHYGVIK